MKEAVEQQNFVPETVADAERYMSKVLTAYDGTEPYIFVSYSHRDTMQVCRVMKIIEREKFRFWYDDTMEIGEDFREELRTRIENCSAFILFISEHSMNSKYCGMEIITAFKNNKKIYPVYLSDNVEIPAPLKMILENIQHVKGSVASDLEKYVKKLVTGLPVETMRSLQVEDGVLVACKDGSVELTIPSDVHTLGRASFKNCEKLEQLHIGEQVRSIEREACRGCKSLKSIELPSSLKKVGESAFRDCVEMTSLTTNNDELELGERTFENCAKLKDVNLSDGISELYGGVFNSCKALEYIRLPSKLNILGESSFADCSSLKSIDIPEPVTKLDDMVFNGCLSLESVDLKDRLTKIGKYAFKDCKSLHTVHIPRSVQSIGSGPFRGCNNLEQIDVDPHNRFFKSLNGILFNKNKSELISYPPKLAHTKFAIPDSVAVIAPWAFCECVNLEEIEVPDSVCEIGEGAFYGCTHLQKIVLPESVVRIDDTAFHGCTELKLAVVPDSVTDFGWGVFSGCDDLTIVCSDSSAAAKYCDMKNIPHREKM